MATSIRVCDQKAAYRATVYPLDESGDFPKSKYAMLSRISLEGVEDLHLNGENTLVQTGSPPLARMRLDYLKKSKVLENEGCYES